MDKQDFYVVTLFQKNACHYFVRYLQQIPNKLLLPIQNKLESPLVYTRINTLTRQQDEEKMFRQLLERKDASIRRIIGCIKSSFHLRELAEALGKNQIIGVGDASVRNSTAGHAYVLETKPPKFHFHAIAPVDCTEEDVTSNRAEGCTILAMLHVVEIICVMFHIEDGSISLFCDNKEALRKRNVSMSTYTSLSIRDTDIKMELNSIIQQLPIKVSLYHVPGHADEDPNFEYDRATQQVQRNIDMHNAVTAFMQNPPPGHIPTNKTPFFPAQTSALTIQNALVAGDIAYNVMLQKHGPTMENRLFTKLGAPEKYHHIIDWEHFKIALKKQNPVQRAQTTKTIYQLWPTASVMEDRQEGRTNICLRCHQHSETIAHVYQCQSRMAKSAFRTALNQFRKKLQKLHTSGPIIQIFTEFLLAHHQNRPPKAPAHNLGNKKSIQYVKMAFEHQMLLRVNIFHLGYISFKWGHLHKMFLDNHKKLDPENNKFNDPQWSTKVIQALWHFSQSVWSQRCSQIHKKDPELEESLFSGELRSSIQSYLRLPRDTLSRNEKALHLNVSKHLKKAFPTTLARWLKLLAEERELTIRSKRNDRIASGGLQPLTKFFRWRAPSEKGN